MNAAAALLIILIFSVINAGLKAWRDYHIIKGSIGYNNHASKWHFIGFIYQVFLYSVLAIILGLIIQQYWLIPFLIIIGGLIYWSFFDCIIGYLLTGSIWHIGTTGWDKEFLAAFYNGWTFLFFKLFWLTIIVLTYKSLFI